jgi:hypothetical protein
LRRHSGAADFVAIGAGGFEAVEAPGEGEVIVAQGVELFGGDGFS